MKRLGMATISSFYGIKILVHPKETYDERVHHIPHIHAEYGGRTLLLVLKLVKLLKVIWGKIKIKW